MATNLCVPSLLHEQALELARLQSYIDELTRQLYFAERVIDFEREQNLILRRAVRLEDLERVQS